MPQSSTPNTPLVQSVIYLLAQMGPRDRLKVARYLGLKKTNAKSLYGVLQGKVMMEDFDEAKSWVNQVGETDGSG